MNDDWKEKGYFNPHDAAGNEDSSSLNYINVTAADHWEAIRRNEEFTSDVKAAVKRFRAYEGDPRNKTLLKVCPDIQRRLRPDSFEEKCLQFIATYEKTLLKKGEPSCSQPWPQTPGWFKDYLTSHIKDSIQSYGTIDWDFPTYIIQCFDALYDTCYVDDESKVNAIRASGFEHILDYIESKKGRLILLPDTPCLNKDHHDEILKELSKQIKYDKRPGRRTYPFKGIDQWKSFLLFEKYYKDGHPEGVCYAVVFHARQYKKWVSMVEAVVKKTFSPEQMTVLEGSYEISQTLRKEMFQGRKGFVKEILQMEEYIDSFYPKMGREIPTEEAKIGNT